MEKHYCERDLLEMDRAGNHYGNHVMAMTREGLHSKSDIAAELGWRDLQIAALQQKLDALAAENAALESIIEPISNLSQYGDIVAEMSEALRPHEVDGFVSLFSRARHMVTPATDDYRNAVRAEGVDMLAAKHQRIVDTLNGDSLFADGERRHAAIAAAAVHFAAQLRAGNAGKDGSHE